MSTAHRLIAIIGRPNVGKSTLFNRLIGQRRSIVTDEPGITRDRIYGTANWSGRSFQVVDTGGIVPGDQTEIPRKIVEQAQVAIDHAYPGVAPYHGDYTSKVVNSLFVGESDNRGTPTTEAEKAYGRSMTPLSSSERVRSSQSPKS